MIGPIPLPLEPEWADVLAEVARELRLPSLDDPRLPQHVAAMAAVYNDDRLSGLKPSREQLAARLGFWFPRDVPKVAGAVREAIALGRLSIDRELRVLDVGAGLGASHRGLQRALAATGGSGLLDVIAVDADDKALQVAAAIAKRRPREGAVTVEVETRAMTVADLCERPPRGRFGAILFGQVLSELDLDKGERRVEHHAEQIASLVKTSLEPRGLVIIVEPALRTRSRHLQKLRAALVARGMHVIAPCLHEGPCPLLGREGDWCHEDLPVDLPEFLVPIAKKAGLRWEGLTFSPLLLSLKGATLADALSERPRLRAVSSILPSKGKRELVVCGDPVRPTPPEGDPLGPNGARIGRLDRAETEKNAELDEVRRGDVITVSQLDDKLRVGPDSAVAQLAPRGEQSPS